MALPKSKTFEKYLIDAEFRARVDLVFERVEPYITEFASSHSLELDKWYHDLPLWTLRSRTGRMVRLIHLAASQADDLPALRVMVNAYMDVPDRNVRYSLPRAILMPHVSESEVNHEPYLIAKSLEEAFHRVKDISERELTAEDGQFTRP